MGLEAKLSLKLSHRLVMTPALQQAIKLLPLTRLELIGKIQEELTENPLLQEEDAITEQESGLQKEDQEEETDQTEEVVNQNQSEESVDVPSAEIDWDTFFKNSLYEGGGDKSDGFSEGYQIENTIKNEVSLGEHLAFQLNLVAKNDTEKYIGAIIIGNLDEDGYFQSSIDEIAKSTLTPPEEVEKVLNIVQGFDPFGVGARDIKESLLIQLSNLDKKNPLAETLVRDYLDNLSDNDLNGIAKELSVSIDEIVASKKVIGELNPKPGSTLNPDSIQYVTPDVVVYKSADGYQVLLNDDGIPRLKISSYYQEVLRNSNTSTKSYLEDKFKSAVWLIKSIEQRRQTLFKVATSIVKFQQDFLDNGLSQLKPLILKNVAEDIEMHESTVSRVTTNKYIYTPQGLFGLKFFFHKGVDSIVGHSSMSSVIVKQLIKDAVEEEECEKPLTDIQIASYLHSKNISIARRTVTKYRKELRIPAASKRKRR